MILNMIQPINSSNIKTSIFYINDFHGKSLNMERVISASNAFNAGNKQPDTDKLKLSSGDIMVGEDVITNKIALMFENFVGITNSAVGNHEHDIQQNAEKVLPYAKFNFLSNNVKINPRNSWSKVTKSSVVEEHNGHKYGIIGTTPVDLFRRSKQGVLQQDVSVDTPRQTLSDIQHEIDKLRQKGVNKIILLSHLGYELDKIVACQTEGLDVILGGHSHDLIIDVKEGKNLFYNKNGEPVIITQAGRDGKNFGILNLEFDTNGIIKKVQNSIGNTKDFRRNLPVKDIFDKIVGSNSKICIINSAPQAPENGLIGINPHAYLITDCMKQALDADIALIQAANIRGAFEKGELDSRTISDILPFKNKLIKINYSEKDIVDAVRYSAKSYINTANKPGIFYASGLRYSVTKNGDIKNMSYIDKSGKEHIIDINNPRENKFYSTIINDYCAEGNDGFSMLVRPNNIVEKYDFDAKYCLEQELKKRKFPVDITDDNRVKEINS